MWTRWLRAAESDETSRRAFPGPTIKAALIIGFSLMFGVWLVAGYYLAYRMVGAERRSAEINGRYMRAQEQLSTVRAQVLLGSVFVRDALLDPDPSTAPEYRERLEETYRLAAEALAKYVPVLDTESERERVAQLRRELDEFRITMLKVLGTDSSQWRSDARVLLRTEIVPRREVVIRVSEQVQGMNRTAFVQQRQGLADMYAVTQRRLWGGLGVALGTSFGIGLLATLYAVRLEERIRQRYVKDEQNARELQRLSAKLIQVQEEERRTIARELHDEIGQALTTIKVELSVAQRAIEASGGPAHLLDDARSVTDGAVGTVRDLSHLLHPPVLDDLGLPAAVEWHLRQFGKRHHLRTEVLCDGMNLRLPPGIETTVYRIVQEALTNVANHANAICCRVSLRRLPETLLVSIEDDGDGFDAAGQPAGERRGLGLIGIRERASELQGTLRIDTEPGRGTRITVELPVQPGPSPATTLESEQVDAFSPLLREVRAQTGHA